MSSRECRSPTHGGKKDETKVRTCRMFTFLSQVQGEPRRQLELKQMEQGTQQRPSWADISLGFPASSPRHWWCHEKTCREPVLSLALLNGWSGEGRQRGLYGTQRKREGTENSESQWKQDPGLAHWVVQPCLYVPLSRHQRMQITESYRSLLPRLCCTEGGPGASRMGKSSRVFTWKYYFRKAHFSGDCCRSIHQVWKSLLNLREITWQ